MLKSPAIFPRVLGLIAVLAISVVAPTSLPAAPVHHPAKHAAMSKNVEEESAKSCWKMTDSDHYYGYTVPCSTPGAMEHR